MSIKEKLLAFQEAYDAAQKCLDYCDVMQSKPTSLAHIQLGETLAQEMARNIYTARAKGSMLRSFGVDHQGLLSVQSACALHYHWSIKVQPSDPHFGPTLSDKQSVAMIGAYHKAFNPVEAHNSMSVFAQMNFDPEASAWGICRPACAEALREGSEFLRISHVFSTIKAPEKPLTLAPFFLAFAFCDTHSPIGMGIGTDTFPSPARWVPIHLIALTGFLARMALIALQSYHPQRIDVSERIALKQLLLTLERPLITSAMERMMLTWDTFGASEEHLAKPSGGTFGESTSQRL